MNINDLTTCANCGKGEEAAAAGDLKACTACKMAKYCNRDCQIAHRPQHKKACKKRAAELHDEKLFKQPPPNEDCPICMLPLPTLLSGSQYSACCGKRMCCGCIHAIRMRAAKKFMGNIKAGIRDIDEQKCAFCRTPEPRSDKEGINQIKKRVKANDTSAIQYLGTCFYNGTDGLPQDRAKALELWHRAAELGNARAYLSIGAAYDHGNGVERDIKKANYYNQEAAVRGEIRARFSLGAFEERNAGNYDRALKHYMIAVRGGDKFSLNMVQEMYKRGRATKEDYTNALRAFQSYLDEIKSPQRDEAAAFGDDFKYY